MRSVLTGDEDEEEQRAPSLDQPSISSLGAPLPKKVTDWRGPGFSDNGVSAQSRESSPRAQTHQGRESPYKQRHKSQLSNASDPPPVPSPSSKPLPHRPFSRTEEDLASEMGTEIVEENIDMGGEDTPSISFVPRVAHRDSPHGTHHTILQSRPGSQASRAVHAVAAATDAPTSRPHSRTQLGYRTPRTHTPDSRFSGETSQDTVRRRESQPPEYRNSMPEPWASRGIDWKDDPKIRDRILFGEESRVDEPTPPREQTVRLEAVVDEETEPDAELVAAFNRVVNMTNNRGDIRDQRAVPQSPISPETTDYPERAYRDPMETILRNVVANDLDFDNEEEDETTERQFPGLTRSGTAPESSAQEYRKNQARSRPSRRSDAPQSSSPPADSYPLTEHELDEPVDPVSAIQAYVNAFMN